MADREQEVTPFTNPGLLFRHLVSAPGAGQVSRLSLAERAGGISAASDFKEMEALLSFLCEHITDPHPLQEILPPQIGEIGASCPGRVIKILHEIASPSCPFLLDQEQSLMLICLHAALNAAETLG